MFEETKKPPPVLHAGTPAERPPRPAAAMRLLGLLLLLSMVLVLLKSAHVGPVANWSWLAVTALAWGALGLPMLLITLGAGYAVLVAMVREFRR